MSRPLISALIVNWNTCQDTLACLDALQAARPKAHDFETIVVENGSRDGSLAALRSRRDIELLANPENRGFAAAVNQAYRIARGELVLLLNPDVTVHQDTLEALIRFLDCHPKVAGVGPAYLNPDGTPQQHHYRLPTFSALIAAVSSLRRLPPWRRAARRHRMLEESFAEPRQLEQPSASCLLLRRDRLPPGPLLDEDFPIYFNDVMLARRLAQRGAALWMTPSAIVHHQLGGSTRQLGDSLSHHHLASIVRYASRTLPAHQVACLKLVIVVEAIGKRVLHRPAPLRGRALRSALRGDPAPLPGTAVLRKVQRRSAVVQCAGAGDARNNGAPRGDRIRLRASVTQSESAEQDMLRPAAREQGCAPWLARDPQPPADDCWAGTSIASRTSRVYDRFRYAARWAKWRRRRGRSTMIPSDR